MTLATSPVRLEWRGNSDGTERIEEGQLVGWVLYVPVPLPSGPIHRAIVWSLRIQEDRWRGLHPITQREEREALGRAIGLLQQGKVRQCVVADKHDPNVVFASTERTRPDRTFFFLGS